MRIRVRLFAGLADDLGVREVDLELPEGATVGDALATLAADRPALGRHRAGLACAVDAVYASADTPLRDGAELGLIPPVSGG